MSTLLTEAELDAAVASVQKAIGNLSLEKSKQMTPAMRKRLYEQGHALYEAARYDEAYKVFVQLIAEDPFNPLGFKAAAAAAQAQGKYEEALSFYAPVLMTTEDPVNLMHFAECLLKLGKAEQAREALDLAQLLCVGEEHGAVREHCATLQRQASLC
ncbi:tetratricopeptide repeat protein [Bordetella sp. LUAb4]|uniref:tetratricopeptide repeat protein n=1 Tax=Bordetella sp. LUAb4 TaxID=2843195 RepID=UPI001E51422B|nr:tetratricopeptide repeat protein [Bordetella sp. LUAb4]